MGGALNMAMTVLGPLDAEDLGWCQCHEHLLVRKGRPAEIDPSQAFDDMDKSAGELAAYRSAGGNTVVDAQPGGCCRMEKELRMISKRSGVHIIASTGFHKMIYYPGNHWIRRMPEDRLREFFVQELTAGMFDNCDEKEPDRQNDIRAGMVKTALDENGLDAEHRRLFRAAAEAAVSADVPLMVHIEAGSQPEELAEELVSCGVQPGRVMFCHMDRIIRDLSFYIRILQQGILLEFDTIGRFKYHGDQEETELLFSLLKEGYGERILLSLDTTKMRLRSYTKDAVGLSYILQVFKTKLIKSGISEEMIHQMMYGNPAALFRKNKETIIR